MSGVPIPASVVNAELLAFSVVFVFGHDLALELQVKCWRRVITTPWSNLADLNFSGDTNSLERGTQQIW